jgi:flagellar basal-body rod protein FlgB
MCNFIKAYTVAIFAALALISGASFSRADDLTDALKLKMKYLSQSQAVISKNLANANTPKYKAMEVERPHHNSKMVSLTTTSPTHIGGIGREGSFKVVKQKDAYETAPNGNNVSIEEQMVKMSANSAEHQAATNIMHKVGSLVALATGER